METDAGNVGGEVPSEADGSDALDPAWERACADWADEDANRKFIALCQALGRLPEAGKRYRSARDAAASEADRALIEAHLDRLFAAAMVTMQALRVEPTNHTRKLLWVAFFVMLAMILGVVVTAMSFQSPPPP